jgi:hypothetical protein
MGEVDGYTAADYLIQHASRERREELPPFAFWDAVSVHVNAADLPEFAYNAQVRGLYRTAAQFYKRAASTGNGYAGAQLLRILDSCQCSVSDASRWTVDRVDVHEISSVRHLLRALHKVGAADQVAALAARAVALVSFDNPYVVSDLLKWLQEHGAADQMNALANRVVADAPLNDPAKAVTLVQALRNAGALSHVAALTARIPLDNPAAVNILLQKLTDLDAHRQATDLAIRAADQTPVENASTVVTLLELLQKVDATDQIAALIARNPAASVAVDDPAAICRLIREFQSIGAIRQMNILASRAASQTLLTRPDGLAQLIHTLRSVGVHDQVGTLLSHDLVGHVILDQVDAVTHLVAELQEAGASEQVAMLAERAAHDVPLDPLKAASLLIRLRQADPGESVAILASRLASGAPVDDPVAICSLILQMKKVGARNQAAMLADRAKNVPVENTARFTFYLGSWVTRVPTSDVQDNEEIPEEVVAIARRAVRDASIENTSTVVSFWRVLVAAGFNDLAATLAARIASNVSRIDLKAVPFLLDSFKSFGAEEDLAEIVTQLAQDASGDPARTGHLLHYLQGSGLDEKLEDLANQAVERVSLENPGAVASLLYALKVVDAHEQIARLLARDPASHASLRNPAGVSYLLETTEKIGAHEQVARLLSRDPVSQITTNDRDGVVEMLQALRVVGAEKAAAVLAARVSNAGMFEVALKNVPCKARWFQFGRKPDGDRAQPWCWEDLS